MAKAYEDLELQDDFMFGKIMQDPKYCKPFLETILGIKIRRVEYPESQKTIDVAAGERVCGWMFMWRMTGIRYLIWRCRFI